MRGRHIIQRFLNRYIWPHITFYIEHLDGLTRIQKIYWEHICMVRVFQPTLTLTIATYKLSGEKRKEGGRGEQNSKAEAGWEMSDYGMNFLSPQTLGWTLRHELRFLEILNFTNQCRKGLNRKIQKSKVYLHSKSWDLELILLLTQIASMYKPKL